MWRNALHRALLMALLAYSATAQSSPVENVKQQFVTSITRDWDAYEVCEHHSRIDDRKAFYVKVFELAPGALQNVNDWREVTVRQGGAGPAVHLGVAELQFASVAQAQSFAQSAKSGPRYLAASKILTRYVVLQRESRALVVYSESHQRAEAARFLDAAPSAAGFWQENAPTTR